MMVFKKLSIYEELGQSIAIIESKNKIVSEEIKMFLDCEDVICVDFKEIKDSYDLGEKILEKCISIGEKRGDATAEFFIYGSKGLQRGLEMMEEISTNKRVSFVAFNFTEILNINESRHLLGYLKASFQNMGNISFIFFCENMDMYNQIFVNLDSPFSRFVTIFDL